MQIKFSCDNPIRKMSHKLEIEPLDKNDFQLIYLLNGNVYL